MRNKTMRVRTCSRILSAVLAAVAAFGIARASHAAAYTYSTRQRTINAGVLIVDDRAPNGAISSGAGQPGVTQADIDMGADDPDPYLFYVLNQRSDLKPFGWNFINPLAPATVTGDILTRWNARTSNGAAGLAFLAANGGNAYTLRQRITPNMAPYWEVSLANTSLGNLLQFDILYLNIPAGHTIMFTDTEVEELRRFVDNGGQLWVEDNGGGDINDPAPAVGTTEGPLFFDAHFNNAASAGQGILPPGSVTVLRHPIVDSPYLLSNTEINTLGETHIQATVVNSAGTLPDQSLFTNVVANSAAGLLPVIAAGQLGAGQVIVTTTSSGAAINDSVGGIDAGFGTNVNYPSNSGPYCGNNYNAAPTADLKLMVNILSWGNAHPTEHKNSHQSSFSSNTLGPALAPKWNYPTAAGAQGGGNASAFTPGAAINGGFVYVRTADGVLRCFNANPGTDLIGTGNPDGGTPDFSLGESYDEIWDSSGNGFSGVAPISFGDPNGSAPTVAAIPNGQTLVFVEKSDGSVYAADAVTGQASPGKLPGSGGGGTYTTIPAPAPTFYEGRLYAGQPNGSLYVYDFNPGGSSATYMVGNGASEYVTSPPAVGIVRDVIRGVQVNEIVAAVTTNKNLYTIQLGARHDNVEPAGAGGFQVQAPSFSGNTPFNFATTFSDIVYTETNGYKTLVSGESSSQFALPGGLRYFADWDASLASAGALTRSEFSINGVSQSSQAAQGTSTAALASDGNLYYTADDTVTSLGLNSTLVCAHDDRQGNNQMKWRFRLPYANENVTDADGINYNGLAGYVFTGTPVVDDQGNVYALAVNSANPKQVAILCINGPQSVSAQAISPVQVPANATISVTSMTQPLVSNSSTDEFGDATLTQIQANQALNSTTPDGNGNVTFKNFAAGATQPASLALFPDISEPQPVQLTYTINSNGAGTPAPPVTAGMHTNMEWYTLLPTLSAVSFSPSGAGPGLTLVGNYLFFGDSSGNLYRFYAYPQDASLVGGNRFVNPGTAAKPTTDNDSRPIFNFTPIPTNAGAINGVASASNNVLVVNGANGVTTLGNSYNLVADSNRIVEVDSDGIATWAVDATSESAPNGALTHLELNRPTSISQFSSNDYLVADTGNNRCVRFDRSGNATWELTRFNDGPLSLPPGYSKAGPLLTPGEPTSLNHPTSVQSYIGYIQSGGAIVGTVIHYLIADTGNNRVLEVVDAFDSKGNPVGVPHNLVWVSHTFDKQGRRYRYTNASYFTGPNGDRYVAALVTNARLAAIPAPANPATGQLGPATADAPGSSLVLLDYDPLNGLGTPGFGSNGQADGFISHAVSSYNIFIQKDPNTGLPDGRFDLNAAPKLIPSASGGNPTRQASDSGTPTVVYLRNPRFLQAYTPPGGAGALQNFLLADDNGVFDLFLDTTGAYTVGGQKNQFVAQWGFTPTDYQNLVMASANPTPPPLLVRTPAPIDSGLPLSRIGLSLGPNPPTGTALSGPIPFVPTSLQRTTTDLVGGFLIGHYILSNGYSQGEVTPTSGFGGEVLELGADATSGPLATLWDSSFSKPGNTGPLSQPAFALREK